MTRDGDSVKNAAIAAINSKLDELLERRRDIIQRRGVLFRAQREIDHALIDCQSAGRLFGLDIDLPKDLVPSAQKRLADGRRIVPPRTDVRQSKLPQAASSGSDEPTVRDIVLGQLMRADHGLTAAYLRSVVENVLHRQIHYKTIGMTLYRLSKEVPPSVRREGTTWFFVPNPETKNPGAVNAGA
jgi:hypothetical protein